MESLKTLDFVHLPVYIFAGAPLSRTYSFEVCSRYQMDRPHHRIIIVVIIIQRYSITILRSEAELCNESMENKRLSCHNPIEGDTGGFVSTSPIAALRGSSTYTMFAFWGVRSFACWSILDRSGHVYSLRNDFAAA